MSQPESIFVFGSNLLGIHGAGAAKAARLEHGAEQWVGEGLTGNAYAIPTKRRPSMRTEDILSLDEIKTHVDRFVTFAAMHPEMNFQITPIGCGLAGYKHEEIAPMFKDVPLNCKLPIEFVRVLRA